MTLEVAHPHGHPLTAVGVDGISEQQLVVAESRRLDGEILETLRHGVLVEQHLLELVALGRLRARQGCAHRPAARDRVLLAFDGADVVGPGPARSGVARVGQLDLCQHGLEEVVHEWLEMFGGGCRVVVLGFEQLHNGGVVAVAQPEPVVRSGVTVRRDLLWPWLGQRRTEGGIGVGVGTHEISFSHGRVATIARHAHLPAGPSRSACGRNDPRGRPSQRSNQRRSRLAAADRLPPAPAQIAGGRLRLDVGGVGVGRHPGSRLRSVIRGAESGVAEGVVTICVVETPRPTIERVKVYVHD